MRFVLCVCLLTAGVVTSGAGVTAGLNSLGVMLSDSELSHHSEELSGHYMYHQFNIQQFYVLPTQCVYVFCVGLRTNNDYFPIQN